MYRRMMRITIHAHEIYQYITDRYHAKPREIVDLAFAILLAHLDNQPLNAVTEHKLNELRQRSQTAKRTAPEPTTPEPPLARQPAQEVPIVSADPTSGPTPPIKSDDDPWPPIPSERFADYELWLDYRRARANNMENKPAEPLQIEHFVPLTPEMVRAYEAYRQILAEDYGVALPEHPNIELATQEPEGPMPPWQRALREKMAKGEVF